MEWLRLHAYLATLTFACLLLVGGGYVLSRNTSVSSGSDATWGSARGIFQAGNRILNPDAPTQMLPSGVDTEFSFTPPKPLDALIEESDVNDLGSLLTQLTSGGSANTGLTTPDAYSFIPQGLVQLVSPQKKMTSEQRALYDYGNRVGATIQGFNALHLNLPAQMRDHAEDRGDSSKAAALARAGRDYQQLAKDLETSNPPALIAASHAEYAKSYTNVGTNLIRISEATTDDTFLQAIYAYNASVEDLNKRFLILVNIFNASGVTFSSFDAGSIFVFSAAASF